MTISAYAECHDQLSRGGGLPWELWLLWEVGRLTADVLGLAAVLFTSGDGKISPVAFIEAVAFSVCPFLSEPWDFMKDIVSSYLYVVMGDERDAPFTTHFFATWALCVTIFAYTSFCLSADVFFDLTKSHLGAWLMPAQNTKPMERVSKAYEVAFKQVSPGKQEVGFGEDLQQGLLAVMVMLRFGGSMFVTAALLIGALRLLAAVFMFPVLRKKLEPSLHEKLRQAIAQDANDEATHVASVLACICGNIVQSVCFAESHDAIVSGDFSGKVTVWDFMSGEKLREVSCGGIVDSVCFAESHDAIVSGDATSKILRWPSEIFHQPLKVPETSCHAEESVSLLEQ
jgi:hypothetical protein